MKHESVTLWLLNVEESSVRLRKRLQPTRSSSLNLDRFPHLHTSQSVSGRTKPMDEDGHNKEPRRSGRIKTPKPQQTAQDGAQHEQDEGPAQSRRRGRPRKPRPQIPIGDDDIDEAEQDESEYMTSPLAHRNNPVSEAMSNSSLVLSPTHTRTGSISASARSSSPSKFKGPIKRKQLANLSPAITFETVGNTKNYWPERIGNLWTNHVAEWLHKSNVMPERLKVRRVRLQSFLFISRVSSVFILG